MKIVIREWLKTPKAILILAATILVAAAKGWGAVQCSVYIPKVVTGLDIHSPDMRRIVFVSVVTVLMDSLYILMESRSYRTFYTLTRNRSVRQLLDANYELYTKYSLSGIVHLQEFIHDASMVGKYTIRISSNAIFMAISIVTLYTMAPQVLLPIALVYGMLGALIWPLYRKIGQKEAESKELMRSRDQLVENAVYGFAEVRVNCMQDYEDKRISKLTNAVNTTLNSKARYNALLMLGASGMDGVGTIIAIVYAIHLVQAGQIDVATGVSMVMLCCSLLGGMMNILDLVDGCSEITVRAEPWKKLMEDAQNTTKDGDIEMTELRNTIDVKNVHFTYGDTGSILNGCTLRIKAGTKVGICGRSGDGKTTLLKLLCRFYDVRSGAIEYDGVNINDIQMESIYKQIAVVSQDITIFPGSIRENVTYGRPGVTEHAVIEACKKAELYDFVMKLPDQLETEVGPRGIKLSGGQRQRIALARMFLKDPSIIILDEATSALDNSSEKLIQRAIEKMKGKTVIMVAHRLTTIQNCDTIFVMENGRIAESGTHEDLKVKGGLYAKMLNASVEE